ncbi:MAG: chromosome segregation protein SMC [Peptococcaceae bacterium]|nr:chromosome segregation protein SMC [Peptococcaceae bacterium]
MFLKRLELYGFKSFADKTVLEFKPGITLVVGPNGSGKSNITDAIRWVLGEQSVKSLRGGKMEDVIFAGSEKRRSLGMAEVSLTIDNTAGDFPLDFNEVTVTRRLYRSGESEYQINKVPCRLKDIHELFMDTGVGREGFSMIGQGKVDEILLARPEERRVILEDAAGIVKYRYRKKEAAKKLDETRQHLLRIDDLLLELESQREPLAKQAQEARRYKLIKDELDQLELGVITGEIRSAKSKVEVLQQELAELRDQLLHQRTGFLTAQNQEEGVRLALDQLNEEINACQEKIYRQSLERERLENESRTDRQQAAALAEQAGDLKEDISRFEKELAELTAKWQSRQEEGASLAEKVAKARCLLQEEEQQRAEADKTLFAGQEEAARAEEAHLDFLKEDAAVQNLVTGHKEQLAAAARQREKAEEVLAKAREELAAARSRGEEVASEGRKLLAEEEARRGELTAAELQVETAAQQLREKQNANRALAAERGQILSRFKLLEEMEKEGQGYAQGVREVLRRRSQDKLPGIFGTVAQSLRVDKEYEAAVEVALGGSAQNVITETERSAQDAIRWLKNMDKGRVTFLPLDTLRSAKPQGSGLPKGKGIVGRLVDLVDFEDKYLPAMEFLLGRIWLADELSNAVARARETDFRYRIVTLDGQVVNAGGSLTGGSMKQSGGGFISRRRQLEELDKEIRRISRELSAGEEEENGLHRAWEEAKEVLAAAGEALRSAQLALAAGEKTRQHSDEEIRRLETALAALENQQDTDDTERVRLEGLILQAQEDRRLLAEKIAENRRSAEKLRQEIQQHQSLRAARQSRLTELRIQLAGDEEKLNSFDKEGGFLKERMGQLESNIGSQQKNIQLCLERSRRHDGACRERQQVIDRIVEELAALEEMKKNRQEKRQSLQAEVSALDENQKAVSLEIQKKEERCHQLELQETRLLANLEEWTSRLEEQYAMEWQTALEQVEPVPEKRRAQARIKEIKDEIAAMPQVNLGAVEEYLRLEERLTFLKEQTQDLIKGKDDLEAVIQEMDQIVAKKFKETFDEVNVKFNEVFQRLFAGGRASLYMTSPDNLLDTGVDIMAQPPGKKAQNLALLSGGEKALAAISLLLAMLQVRPSPFSILDEIESALDEANVERFAALVKEYSRESGSQFIIITHRRGTMTIGDVLYGVSAEEFSGVSKILSVKIEEEPDYDEALPR